MIAAKLVDLALRQRLLVLTFVACLVGYGAESYLKLPIDAFPDVAPTQVHLAMRAPGLTPEEVESRITAPIEINMRGIPHLAQIRSVTRYSNALVTLEFAPGTDIYWARAQVNERIGATLDQLPASTSGGIAPIVTPLGDMVMFTIEGANLSPTEKRSIIDWVIRPALRALPGVADVNTLGGFVRSVEVQPDPVAMASRGITMPMLESALAANNRNDGAGRIADGEEVFLVRIEGRIRDLDDVRSIVVVAKGGNVVRVADIARVRFGGLTRNGVVTRDGAGETVWGVVLGLRGANAKDVVNAVKSRFEELSAQLPEGARIEIFYDRNDLIEKAVWTVQKVLIEAIVLVVVLLVIFLGNLRAAFVVALILPFAVLATFVAMRLWGLSANLMSLGGLAIAIGMLVDAAVVVVENAAHHMVGKKDIDFRERIRIIGEATHEVVVPLIAGISIIITVFLPLLTLEGLEGRLFIPVALTIVFALVAALLLSLTVIPVLCSFVLRDVKDEDPWTVRQIHRVYDPALDFLVARPKQVAAAAIGMLVATAIAYPMLGKTFLPVMDEGTIVLTVRKMPSIGLEETADLDLLIQRELKSAIPEINTIMARAGSDELGLDPVGLNETDMFFTMRPEETWRVRDRGWILEEMRKVLTEIPGISFVFTQPIDMRVQEMIIGARGDIVVKVFGPDLDRLNAITGEVANILRATKGSQDVFALRNEGMKYLSVQIDRLAAGRLGLNVSEIQDTLKVWIEGKQVGLVLEGQVRTPLLLRGGETLRDNAASFANMTIVLPTGEVVPITQVARIVEEDGPVQVIREQVNRYSTVQANVVGRDLVGFVDEARKAVNASVNLPKGYHMVWGGQFENQQRAAARLSIVVPVALALIFLLLYFTFGSVRQAVLVLCNIPFALVGGVFGLWVSGQFLSVPASVGFIALIGIAVLNGVVMISYFNKLHAEGMELGQLVVLGARRRLRPVLLTASIAAFGLVPFLFADGPGSEIQLPLATVVISGLVTATFLTIFIMPILFKHFGVPKHHRHPEEASR